MQTLYSREITGTTKLPFLGLVTSTWMEWTMCWSVTQAPILANWNTLGKLSCTMDR